MSVFTSSIYERLIELQDEDNNRQTYYLQLIDECCICTFDRFQEIQKILPLEQKSSALNASLRCMNRKVLKKYIPEHPELISSIFVYSCQLNYDAFVKFLVTWIDKYEQHHLISDSQKHCSIWWCFRNRNSELAAFLIFHWNMNISESEFEHMYIEIVPSILHYF
jgi:hypothetical protein